MTDLARRLPTMLSILSHFLRDNYGSTSDPSFDSLLAFVNNEELIKSSDFAVSLLGDERRKDEQGQIINLNQSGNLARFERSLQPGCSNDEPLKRTWCNYCKALGKTPAKLNSVKYC